MTSMSRSSRVRCSGRPESNRSLMGFCVFSVVLAGLGACASQPAQSPSTTQGTPAAPTGAEVKLAELRSQLDRELLAGPSVTDPLGYRTLWQARVTTTRGSRLIGSDCTPEEIFVWDSGGIVTRLRPSSGDALWQTATASAVDRILSMLSVERRNGAAQVALLTDTQCILIDASNGTFVDVQGLRRLANTAGVVRTPFLIYGTRAGQVVWHDFEIGSASHLSEQAGQILHAPRVVGSTVIAASTGGAVATYRLETSRLIWERSLGARIDARPAADERAVWVPSLDQYLSCLSLRDGRVLWRYFTQAPMDASPTLLLDNLYMQLPGEGLVCFDPLPQDRFDGVVRWRSPEVRGDIIGICRNGLIAWDAPTGTLSLLEERTGAIIRSFRMEGVADLELTTPIDGDLVVTGSDGRVQRMTPVVKRSTTGS